MPVFVELVDQTLKFFAKFGEKFCKKWLLYLSIYIPDKNNNVVLCSILLNFN